MLGQQLFGDRPEAIGRHTAHHLHAFFERLLQLVLKQALAHGGVDAGPLGQQLDAVAGDDVLGHLHGVLGGGRHHMVQVVRVDLGRVLLDDGGFFTHDGGCSLMAARGRAA